MSYKNYRQPEPIVVDKDYAEYMRIVLRADNDPVWFATEHLGVTLFPEQERILREFYAGNYKKLYLAAGMRSGKSILAGIIGTIELQKILTLENPANHYKLAPGQKVHISCVAASEDQARDTLFSNIAYMVENSEYFQTWTDCKIRGLEIESKRKNVVLKTISSWATTAVGRSNICVLFDEISSFEATQSKRGAWEVYNKLSNSTDTFGNNGHIVAISSVQHPTDIMMTLYKRGLEDSNTLSILKPTWEMNPHFTEEALRYEKRYDMPAFYRDFACQPGGYGSIEFPEGVKLNEGIQNVLIQNVISRKVSRVMAIDPAVRNDSFGIACGFMSMGGKIIIDGVTKFKREDGEQILDPTMVREFILGKISDLNIDTLITDTWMFPELIQQATDRAGIQVEQHTVRKVDYDRWRELQNDGLCDIVYDDHLKMEAEQLLIINPKRVDHPTNGSKDVADCVANVIWYITNNMTMSEQPPIFISRGF